MRAGVGSITASRRIGLYCRRQEWEVEMTIGRVFSVMSLLAMLTAVAATLAAGG
jgi:hypothetical protein